jgi:nucleoside-diphosphate-sugar epimerase
VPTDEAHPSRPKDTYGISKLMAEETCRLASAQWGLTVICLRLPWVLTEHDVATMAEHVRRPEARPFGLWCWVDQRDAAQAVRLAVEDERLAGYQQFIITADDTGTAADSAALLAEFYPSVTDIRAEMAGRRSLVSSARAKRELGFRPAYTLADGPLADVLTAARRGPESGGRSAL